MSDDFYELNMAISLRQTIEERDRLLAGLAAALEEAAAVWVSEVTEVRNG